MSVLGVLRCPVLAVGSRFSLVSIRHGHHRVVKIQPSRFQFNKFKDDMHFYFMLGAIPLGALTFYVNVTIGPAQLSEIPDGYEPKKWEYYRHPISRFFAQYFHESPEEIYEKTCAVLYKEMEKRELRLLEKKVKKLMKERGDYESWYYVPFTAKYHRVSKKIEDLSENLVEGSQLYDVEDFKGLYNPIEGGDESD